MTPDHSQVGPLTSVKQEHQFILDLNGGRWGGVGGVSGGMQKSQNEAKLHLVTKAKGQKGCCLSVSVV